MPRIRFLLVASLACLSTGSAAVAGLSPFPDPAERAAFQKHELERRSRWVEIQKRPATKEAIQQERYDVTYYRLSLDLRDLDHEQIVGDVTIQLRVVDGPIGDLPLDLRAEMQVDSVFLGSQRAVYTHAAGVLTLHANSPLAAGEDAEIRVCYHGHPRESDETAFGWDSHEGIPLIWSLSEPQGARDWWPCKDRPDDKADSIDVLLRGPEGFVCTSNGLLVETIDHGDQSRTFHWRHTYPIATYLVCVTATAYDRIEDRYVSAEGDTLLIEHFVYPDKLAQAQEDFSITAPAMALYVDRFGPYPFLREKYGHSLFPWRGGMEHQTNTSYGGDLVDGTHRYDWILVHELSHQWWGDMTSPADWRDIWLNEGFASYAEALWAEHNGGASAYRDYMVHVQLVYDPSGPLYDPLYLFDGNTVYNKGAWAVHMLRGVLGDSVFYAVLDTYRAETEYRSTTTEEFQSIAERVSGRALDWFFDPWVYGVNRPRYETSFEPLGGTATPGVAIHIDQTQQTAGFFTMPLDLEIAMEGGDTARRRIWHDPDHLDFEFDLNAPAVGVVVDPDNWILCYREAARYGLNITTTDLPDGVAKKPFAVALQGRGGSPPYAWSKDAAHPLPDSLAIDQTTGILSGTAPDSGVYVFSLKLWDRLGKMDRQSYTWKVGGEPQDTTIDNEPDELVFNVGPSPGRAEGWIGFNIDGPGSDWVRLDIFDVQGRHVRSLWDGPAPGRWFYWDGRGDSNQEVASGIYVARLRTSTGRTINRRVAWIPS